VALIYKTPGGISSSLNCYSTNADEIFGDERLDMMLQWADAVGLTIDDSLYEGGAPLREFEVFYWTPR